MTPTPESAPYTITNAVIQHRRRWKLPTCYDNKGGATACISANGASNAIAVGALTIQEAESPTTPCVLRAYDATNLSAGTLYQRPNPLAGFGGRRRQIHHPHDCQRQGLCRGAVFSDGLRAGGKFCQHARHQPRRRRVHQFGDREPFGHDGRSVDLLHSGRHDADDQLDALHRAVRADEFGGGHDRGLRDRGGDQRDSQRELHQQLGRRHRHRLARRVLGKHHQRGFITAGFNAAPTLIRIDPTINFDWSTTPPAANVGPDVYCVRWTGTVEPQFSETYTFSTTTDDGVLLWVNGQLLVNEWVDQASTTWSGSIALLAQQRYNIEMDYYQNGGDALAQLFWSSPSMGPMTIIPESQLYPVTNPPPSVLLTAPTNGAALTADASVTLSAEAAAQFNAVSAVAFYINGQLFGTASNPPYVLTDTGLPAGRYTLTAVASDTTGLTATSAPVSITVNAATGLPYGLTNYSPAPAFFNMPPVFTGPLPALLSLTGVFSRHSQHGPCPQPDSVHSQRAVVVRRRAEGALLFGPQ